MEEKSNILFEVKSLSNLVKRQADNINDKDGLTGMQGFVIGYLFEQKDRDVFQRDLEARFLIRRSTATEILKLMEKKELIRREPVPHDARLKKLTLTPKAIGHHEKFLKEMGELEVRAVRGLTKTEIETFMATLDKIKQNIK